MVSWGPTGCCPHPQQYHTTCKQDADHYEHQVSRTFGSARAPIRAHSSVDEAAYQQCYAGDIYQFHGSSMAHRSFSRAGLPDGGAHCGSLGMCSFSSEQQARQGGDYDATFWLPPMAEPASPEEVAAMIAMPDEEADIITMQLLSSSSSAGETKQAFADSCDVAATVTTATEAGRCISAAEQVLMLLKHRICPDALGHPAAAAAPSNGLQAANSSAEAAYSSFGQGLVPSPAHGFDPQQQFFFSSQCDVPEAPAAGISSGARGVKRCSTDGVTTSHSSLTGSRMCRSVSDTAAAPSRQGSSPRYQQQQASVMAELDMAAVAAAAAAYHVMPAGACSPGAVSCVQDTEDPSAGTAAAAVTAVAAATGVGRGGNTASRSKARKGSQAAAAAAQPAGVTGAAGTRRVRQRRYNEVVALTEQLASVTSKQADMDAKLDTLRTENSSLLTRLADITSKWQGTVADNARLTRENSEGKALISELQQRLMAYEKRSQAAYHGSV